MAIGFVFLCVGLGFATSMIALLSGHSVFAAFLKYSATGILTEIGVALGHAMVLYGADLASGILDDETELRAPSA